MNDISAFRAISASGDIGNFTAVKLDGKGGDGLSTFNTSLLRRNVGLFAKSGSEEGNRAVRQQLLNAFDKGGADAVFMRSLEKFLGVTQSGGFTKKAGEPLLLRDVRAAFDSFDKHQVDVRVAAQKALERTAQEQAQTETLRTELTGTVDEMSRKLSPDEFPPTLAEGLKKHVASASLEELTRIKADFAANVLIPAPGCVDRFKVAWRREQYEALAASLVKEIAGIEKADGFSQMAKDVHRGMSITFNGAPIPRPDVPSAGGFNRYSDATQDAIEALFPAETPENLKTAVLALASQTSFNALGAEGLYATKAASLISMLPQPGDSTQTIGISTLNRDGHPVFRIEVESEDRDFQGFVPMRGGQSVGVDCMDPNRSYHYHAVMLVDLGDDGNPRISFEKPPETSLDFGTALDEAAAVRLNLSRLPDFLADPATPAAVRQNLVNSHVVLTDAQFASLMADPSIRPGMERALEHVSDPPLAMTRPMMAEQLALVLFDAAVKLYNAPILAAAQAPADLSARGYTPAETAAFKAAVAFELAQTPQALNGRPVPPGWTPSASVARFVRYPQFTASKEAAATGREFFAMADEFVLEMNALIRSQKRPTLEGQAKEALTRLLFDELVREEPDPAKWPHGMALKNLFAKSGVVGTVIEKACTPEGAVDYLSAFQKVSPDKRVALAEAMDLLSLPNLEYTVQALVRHVDDLARLKAEGGMTRRAVWMACTGTPPPKDIPEPDALRPKTAISQQIIPFFDQTQAKIDHLVAQTGKVGLGVFAYQLCALMPWTKETETWALAGRAPRLTDKMLNSSVFQIPFGTDFRHQLADDLRRINVPYDDMDRPAAQLKPCVSRFGIVFPDGTRSDYASKGTLDESTVVAHAMASDLERLCGTAHPEQVQSAGMLLSQIGMSAIRQGAVLLGISGTEHSPAEYDVRRDPSGDVLIRVSNPPDSPLVFNWTLRVDQNGVPHLEHLQMDRRDALPGNFPDFQPDPVTGTTPADERMMALVRDNARFQNLDAEGFEFMHQRGLFALHQALTTAADPATVDRDAVLKTAMAESMRSFRKATEELASMGISPVGPGSDHLGWFRGLAYENQTETVAGAGLIQELRQTNPSALATQEAFYREVCARTDTVPDWSQSAVARMVAAGRMFATMRQENAAISRDVLGAQVNAYLEKRLAALAADMGLAPVPAAADLRAGVVAGLARRIAAATRKIVVPGPACDALLESELRMNLFERKALAATAAERQALVASEPGMVDEGDKHVLNAIRGAVKRQPDLCARLETASGAAFNAALSDAMTLAKARARNLTMTDCARFRAQSQAEARVRAAFGADWPADVHLNVGHLRESLAHASAPDDLAEHDAAFYDAPLQPRVDRFVAGKESLLASVRGLPEDTPRELRAYLLKEILENGEIQLPNTPTRVVEIASGMRVDTLPDAPKVEDVVGLCRTFGESLIGALDAEERKLGAPQFEAFAHCVNRAFVAKRPDVMRAFSALSESDMKRVQNQIQEACDQAQAAGDRNGYLNLVVADQLFEDMGRIVDEARAARAAAARQVVVDRLDANREEVEARLESLLTAWPDSAAEMRGALMDGVRARCLRAVFARPSEEMEDAGKLAAVVDREVDAFVDLLAAAQPAHLAPFAGAGATSSLALLGEFTDKFDVALNFMAEVARANPGALDARDPGLLRAEIARRLGGTLPPGEALGASLAKLVAASGETSARVLKGIDDVRLSAHLSQAFSNMPPDELPLGGDLDGLLAEARRRARGRLGEILSARFSAVPPEEGELRAALGLASRRAAVEATFVQNVKALRPTLLAQVPGQMRGTQPFHEDQVSAELLLSPTWRTRVRAAADDLRGEFAHARADFGLAARSSLIAKAEAHHRNEMLLAGFEARLERIVQSSGLGIDRADVNIQFVRKALLNTGDVGKSDAFLERTAGLVAAVKNHAGIPEGARAEVLKQALDDDRLSTDDLRAAMRFFVRLDQNAFLALKADATPEDVAAAFEDAGRQFRDFMEAEAELYPGVPLGVEQVRNLLAKALTSLAPKITASLARLAPGTLESAIDFLQDLSLKLSEEASDLKDPVVQGAAMRRVLVLGDGIKLALGMQGSVFDASRYVKV